MTVARINSYIISYARKRNLLAVAVSKRLYNKLLGDGAQSVWIPFRHKDTGQLDYIKVYYWGDY